MDDVAARGDVAVTLGPRTGERGAWRSIRGFFADPKAKLGGAILAVCVVVAAFAPLIAPYGENAIEPARSLQGPSLAHPLGTDRLGRDILSRVIYGSRISLAIGLVAAGLATLVGVPLGILAGYAGGLVDDGLMRFVDAWIAFPNLILILGIITVIGAGAPNLMVAIGIGAFPLYARLARGQTLTLKQRDFVLAARALGASPRRIMLRHILPNALQPVIVQATLFTGAAVLAEAGLSFLGIGVKPPTATWGVIISDGFAVIKRSPWGAVMPGFAIILFVMSVNLLGDRIRDVTDPRLRGSIRR
jgi:ABC-type dipeptide/oligopeptide/nickel transport system permease subunit